MRRKLDAYLTPEWQTHALLSQESIKGVVLEPCSGNNDIARMLGSSHGVNRVITNDVNTQSPADHSVCACRPDLYDTVGAVDWVVTNPPYRQPLCRDIVSLAVERARIGVAMCLRLSFLEPTSHRNPRGPWLAEHPPSRLIVLPRCSYTGDGNSDSVTTAWFVWKSVKIPCEFPIVCLPDAKSSTALDDLSSLYGARCAVSTMT